MGSFDDPDGRGPVTITGHLDPAGTFHLSVSDNGTWRPPPQPNPGRGRGLAIVQRLAQRLTIDHDRGTTAHVEYRPWKTSHGTRPRPPATDPKVGDVYFDDSTSAPTLTGPIDALTARDLEAHLALSTTPGSPDLTIDLNRTAMLSSTAVAALRTGLHHARHAEVPTTIRAQPGTVAHQVLTLTTIPISPTET